MKHGLRNEKNMCWAAAISAVAALACFAIPCFGQIKREPQTFPTATGAVVITPIYHASALIEAGSKAIYIDPARPDNFSGLPPADLILITSAAPGHMDSAAVAALTRSGTEVWAPQIVAKSIKHVRVLTNGRARQWLDWSIQAIAAYMVHKDGSKGGAGSGYVLGFGGKRFYFSGDTGAVPEMLVLRNIDVAFVCMGDGTMTAWEAAAAVHMFRPKTVIPYADRGADLNVFQERLEGYSTVRLLNWYPPFPAPQ